jgi:hypothetical protein
MHYKDFHIHLSLSKKSHHFLHSYPSLLLGSVKSGISFDSSHDLKGNIKINILTINLDTFFDNLGGI